MPISSAKPLSGSALGVAVGVPGVDVGPVGLTACVCVRAAWVCARAAWVSKAFTVCVAGSGVGEIRGVFVSLGVLVGGTGVELAVRVAVEVLVACMT